MALFSDKGILAGKKQCWRETHSGDITASRHWTVAWSRLAAEKEGRNRLETFGGQLKAQRLANICNIEARKGEILDKYKPRFGV